MPSKEVVMRHVLFIGVYYCGCCNELLDEVVKPLMRKYPDNVTAHYGWDEDIARVNGRKRIRNVPLFVVENGGVEEFRFNGRLSAEQIEGIVTYEGETLTLDDVMGGDAP